MQADHPKVIAAGLSETQKLLVLWLDDRDFKDWLDDDCPGEIRTRRAVERLTEAGRFSYQRRLNPVGSAVKSYLLGVRHG